MNEKWDKRFLDLARTISQWSKDPSTKVGAVITRGNRIVSIGYNGFATGVKDNADRYADRDFKYAAVSHAENNCLLFAKQDLSGCTIYTWPMPPCSNCATSIIQAGITRIVSIHPSDNQLERWANSFRIANVMYSDVGIFVELYCIEDIP